MPKARPDGDPLRTLGAALAEQIERHHVPGAALALWHDGCLHSAAAGYANAPAGIEADSRTLFQIGSITKVFTTSLALQLAEQGLLELDRPATAYLPQLKIAGRECPAEVTVRRLLDHTSGIDSDLFQDFGSDDAALARYVDACERLGFVHAPGRLRSYSNSAYCIAGRVLEVVTQRPFNRLLAERLLQPLGLEPFGFCDAESLRWRTALGHQWDAATATYRLPAQLCLPPCMSPAGSTLSLTAEGLLRFARLHLDEGRTVDGRRVLSAASVRAMQRPYDIPPATSSLRLGWGGMPSAAGEFVAASGAALDQNSFVVLHPARGFALALLTNTAGGADRLLLDLGMRLIEHCTGVRPQFRARAPLDLDLTQTRVAPATIAVVAGEYGTGTSRFQVAAHGDGLALAVTLAWSETEPPRTERMPLVPLDERRFVPVAVGGLRVVVEFLTDAAGGPATHLSYGNRLYPRAAAGGES